MCGNIPQAYSLLSKNFLESRDVTLVYKAIKLNDGRTATLHWLTENDMPEVVEALNSVIREGNYLFMNSEMTDTEEERSWFKRGLKAGARAIATSDAKNNPSKQADRV